MVFMLYYVALNSSTSQIIPQWPLFTKWDNGGSHHDLLVLFKLSLLLHVSSLLTLTFQNKRRL